MHAGVISFPYILSYVYTYQSPPIGRITHPTCMGASFAVHVFQSCVLYPRFIPSRVNICVQELY